MKTMITTIDEMHRQSEEVLHRLHSVIDGCDSSVVGAAANKLLVAAILQSCDDYPEALSLVDKIHATMITALRINWNITQ